MKTKEMYFNKSKKISLAIIIVDLLYILLVAGLFIYLFSVIRVPLKETGSYDPSLLDEVYMYDSIFGQLSTLQINFWLTMFAFFLIFTIPLLVGRVKRYKNQTVYDINDYTGLVNFFYGIISILVLNPVSAVLNFINTFTYTKVTHDYGFIGFFKDIPNRFEKRHHKKLVKQENKENLQAIIDESNRLDLQHFGEGYIKNKTYQKDELYYLKNAGKDERERFLERKRNRKKGDNQADEVIAEAARIKKEIRSQNSKLVIKYIVIYTFLILMAIFIILPFYWMILTSLKTYYESSNDPNPSFFIWPWNAQWINFRVVLEELSFGKYIVNTLFVGVVSTIGTVITTILAAYAFARIEFKGREGLFTTLLMTMMVPGELFIITNFITVGRNGLGWTGMPVGQNHYFLAMIIPFMTSISYIFFLRQAFKQVSNSLYQAAKVDGCSDFKFLLRVMVPIASPTISTITILSIIGSWNAFIWPRLITAMGPEGEGKAFWLISVALRDANFNDGDRLIYSLQIAASALVTVPLLIVFLALRKFIMSGVGRSGTKG